ncbi:MAG: hypothetical protein V4858_12075 [Pseudomonadota bacterium]
MTDFQSPLTVTSVSSFNALAFGVPALPDALLALRRDLQSRLHGTLQYLPHAMRLEAQGMVQAYSGHPEEFYRLFYQPVWSFLHWVMANATPTIPASAIDDARTAQALGLFLHLWDDHLCDGQLATTQLSLQVRTDAWSAYIGAARRLAQHMGMEQRLVDDHATAYLGAIHIPETIHNLDDFCARFERQIAIWTLVPRLIAPAIGAAEAGEDLVRVLKTFSNAWRLMDDIQDVEDDVVAGVESAVWQVLPPEGRLAWAAAHAAAKASGQLEPESWAALQTQLDASACISHLLVRTYDWLETAAALAQKHGWSDLATEILAHRPFELTGKSPPEAVSATHNSPIVGS